LAIELVKVNFWQGAMTQLNLVKPSLLAIDTAILQYRIDMVLFALIN
jgi:hypothetical protein